MTVPGPAEQPEVLSALRGARVRRVDVPEEDLVAITLAIGRETATLIVSVSQAASGIGIVATRPRGEPAGSFAQLLRKHLQGSAIARCESPGLDEVCIIFDREQGSATLHVTVRMRAGGVVLIDASGRRLGGAPSGTRSVPDEPRGPADPDAWPRDLDELLVAGAALMARREGSDERDRDAALRRPLVRARAKLERRARAIEGDLAASGAATQLRADAALILASLGTIASHASEVSIVDPETGLARSITLDPALPATKNADRLFVKARKLDRGARIAEQRLVDARREIAAHDAALEALARGDAGPAEALARPSREPAKTERAPRRVPYRTFTLEDGTTMLVGRGARDNDALTFRHAAPDDLFFHARGQTGAHVILRVSPSTEPSDEARLAAASLAAHFSAARGDTAVDVSCGARRDLRRGRAPGSVVMRASTTLRVRMDAPAIAALLAREIRS